MQLSIEWPDLDDAEYTASDEEVVNEIVKTADKHNKDPEEVAETIINMIDTTGQGELVNEGTTSLSHNPDTKDDTRLEALNIWDMTQSL